MKKLLFVLLGFLIISSCKEKEKKAPLIAVESISFPSSSTPLELKVGDTHPLTPTILPANASDKSIEWKSSDETVATVSENGVVTGMKVGSAIITAKSKSTPSKTATRAVTVTPLPVSTITLTSNPATLTVGGTVQLTAAVAPENAFNKAVTWSSSDPSKATVDNNGLARGIARGSVTITATAADGSAVKGEIALIVKSADAAVSAITLGAENFVVAVPAEGATTIINHAPRTISSNLATVPVNITVADGSTIKVGETAFTSGQTANFTNAVTFTVTAEDGTIKTYRVAITAYNATTNPYGIYTAAHLNDVRNDKGGSYKMMSNIDLPERNAAAATATGISDYAEKGWLPIAHDAVVTSDGNIPAIERGFTGKFDGGGFFIDNFYINRSSSADEHVGLFGVTSGAEISNVGIKGNASLAVTGFRQVGALVGYISQGSVSNCYAEVAVHLESDNSGNFTSVGGLVGYSLNAAISKSYSSGKVSGNRFSTRILPGISVGGLLGYIEGGTIRDCFATGNVAGTSGLQIFVGALAGVFSSTAVNCYATGNVECTAPSSFTEYLGITSTSHTYTNCYYNSAATLRSNGNPVTAPSSASLFTAKTIVEMRTDAFRDLLNAGANVWGRDGAKNNDGLPFIVGVGVGKP